MTRTTRSPVGMVACIALALLVSTGCEAPPAGRSSPGSAGGVQVSVHVDRSRYATGETLRVRVRLENSSDKDIELNAYDIEHRLRTGILLEERLHGVSSDRPEVRALRPVCYEKRKMPIVTRDDFIALKPGESMNSEFSLESAQDDESAWRFVDATAEEHERGSGIRSLPA